MAPTSRRPKRRLAGLGSGRALTPCPWSRTTTSTAPPRRVISTSNGLSTSSSAYACNATFAHASETRVFRSFRACSCIPNLRAARSTASRTAAMFSRSAGRLRNSRSCSIVSVTSFTLAAPDQRPPRFPGTRLSAEKHRPSFARLPGESHWARGRCRSLPQPDERKTGGLVKCSRGMGRGQYGMREDEIKCQRRRRSK